MSAKPTAIIFDLDNCLAAADEVGQELLEPVFDAVRAANDGALPPDALERAFRDCWFHAFDWVAERHGFTGQMRAAGWDVLRRIEVRRPMCGYGDLDVLPELGQRRFLVTSGFRRLQESKVRALGIASHFEAIVVDAVDERDRLGKEHIFTDLIARFALRPESVLIVGDNAESELAAAARLGLPSAQIMRPGVIAATGATVRVDDLRALRAWIDTNTR